MYPPHPRPDPIRVVAGLAATTLTAIVIAACGSSSSPASSAVTGTAKQQECTALTDVLANGPDPTADPVGYAQAQVLLLRQVTVSDSALRGTVQRLDAAYQAFSRSNGDPQDAVTVTTEQNALNAVCPGAAP